MKIKQSIQIITYSLILAAVSACSLPDFVTQGADAIRDFSRARSAGDKVDAALKGAKAAKKAKEEIEEGGNMAEEMTCEEAQAVYDELAKAAGGDDPFEVGEDMVNELRDSGNDSAADDLEDLLGTLEETYEEKCSDDDKK